MEKNCAYLDRRLEDLRLTNTFTPRTLNKINRNFWIDKRDIIILKELAESRGNSLSKELRLAIKHYLEDEYSEKLEVKNANSIDN